jgi:hypothetical protein
MVAALPTAIRPFWGIMRHPWILVPLGLVASAVELGLHSKKSDDGSRVRARAGGFVASVGYSAAALLALSIALSALVDYPSAPVVDLQHPPSTISYISGMLSAAVTMFRFGHHDFLTSQSFWSGFGWLDTSLPESIVTALSVGSGAALVFTLVVIARTRAYRAGTLLFVVIAGLLAAFVVSSLTVRSTPAALHGRYLLGIYICLITLCWQWLPRTIPEARSLAKTIVLVACGVCVIAIHALAFATILGRYFD